MNRIARHIITYITIIVIITITAGCKRDSPAVINDSISFTYVAEYIPLPNDIGDLSSFTYHDNKVYFIAIDYGIGDNTSKRISVTSGIYSMNIDGTELIKLPDYSPVVKTQEGVEEVVYIREIAFDNDSYLWIVEEWTIFEINISENSDGANEQQQEHRSVIESGCFIRKLSNTGQELHSVDVSNLINFSNLEYITALTVGSDSSSGDNYIFLSITNFSVGGNSIIYVLDDTGNIRLQVDTGQNNVINNFIVMPNGQTAYPTKQHIDNGKQFYVLQTIDIFAIALDEVINLTSPDDSNISDDILFFSGNNEHDIYINNNIGVYGCALGSEEIIELLRWRDSNIIPNDVQIIEITSDESVICINSFDNATEVELIILTKTSGSKLPEKTKLTLATFGLSRAMNDAVTEFNRKNNDYYIEITDYSQYNTANDSNAGYTRFTVDVTSGNSPDILDNTSRLPYTDYVSNGLLADLYPFIDGDPMLDRSDFVPSALLAAEIDGGLYRVVSDFFLLSIVGHPSVVGTQSGWNINEMKNYVDDADADIPMGGHITDMGFFVQAFAINIDTYINWDTETVSFDNESFINLLELAGKFPNVPNTDISASEAISAGRQIMIHTVISDFYSYQKDKEVLGGQIIYKGFPVESKNGTIILFGDTSPAIIEQSPNKDGAWEFVRTFLSSDWQINNTDSFPLNQLAFDKKYEKELNWMIENVGKIELGHKVEEPTQEDLDMILTLINTASAGPVRSVDETIANIIIESTSGFFQGINNAEEVAHILQDRISTYVSERS